MVDHISKPLDPYSKLKADLQNAADEDGTMTIEDVVRICGENRYTKLASLLENHYHGRLDIKRPIDDLIKKWTELYKINNSHLVDIITTTVIDNLKCEYFLFRNNIFQFKY
jgi:hypothetical protein